MPQVPHLLVWNKLDLVDSPPLPPDQAGLHYAACTSVSALRGTGLEELRAEIETLLARQEHKVRLHLPWDRGDLLSDLYQSSSVGEIEHTVDGVFLTVSLSPDLFDRYSGYLVETS